MAVMPPWPSNIFLLCAGCWLAGWDGKYPGQYTVLTSHVTGGTMLCLAEPRTRQMGNPVSTGCTYFLPVWVCCLFAFVCASATLHTIPLTVQQKRQSVWEMCKIQPHELDCERVKGLLLDYSQITPKWDPSAPGTPVSETGTPSSGIWDSFIRKSDFGGNRRFFRPRPCNWPC